MMIPHHEQAIEMSDLILAKDGVDPQVVELAEESNTPVSKAVIVRLVPRAAS